MKRMEKTKMRILTVLLLMVLGCAGCATTHYKTKNQLPKSVRFIPIKKQFEIDVSDIRNSGFRYLKCLGSDEKHFLASDRIPSDVNRVKIIGKYFYWPKGHCSNDRPIRDDFYVGEVKNFGYVFFYRGSIDKKLDAKQFKKHYAKQKKLQKEYDDFLDKLNPNDRDLINSTRFGNYQQMVWSIKYGANVNVSDYHGVTPLMLASRRGLYEMAKYLLNHNAKVNMGTKYNPTALMIAATYGKDNIVELLIAHGAKVNIKDKTFGMTAYDLAKVNKHTNVMLILKLAGG